MKDVAILTKYFKNYNYGGMLQGYALHRVIEKLGYSADLISYDVTKNRNSVYPSIFVQAKQYSVRSAVSKIGEKAIGKGKFFIEKIISDRVEKFNQFMEETGADTEIYNDDTMKFLKQQYKVFISGSDQVWNPNAVRNLYLQIFSANRARKISYAASIGRDQLSEFEANVMIPAIKQFGAISVRETTAKKLLESYVTTPIKTLLDPTMLLSVDEWTEIATQRSIKEDYALLYFFSDSLEVRKSILKFCKRNNLQFVMIPYAKQEYNLTDQIGPGIRYNLVGPKEFVSLIKNAAFVFTDSFHGAVFSIIYQKPFAVFERNKKGHISMNSRLYDLLDTFEERNRLIDISRISEIDKLFEIDSEKIKRILVQKKEESLSFLRTSIERGIIEYEREKSAITISCDESSCSGCSACASVCPKKCISFKTNDNGFLIPVIDKKICIRCGKCLETCPFLSKCERHMPKKIISAYRKTPEQRSASGGIAFSIAKRMLEAGGVVYGAAYDNNLHVKIIRVNNQIELEKLQGSKYVQADMTDVIPNILFDLKSGKKVLFSGTPCEVAGVKTVAKKKGLERELYTAEIICHGTPSPKMFADYLLWAEGHYGKKITSYAFRAKNKDTDKDFMIHFGFSNGSECKESGFKDPYYKLFLSSRWFRESCYECSFAVKDRVADITLGDFWNSERLPEKFGKGRRISVVLVNTQKGQSMIDAIHTDIEQIGSSWDVAAEGNANIYRATRKNAGYLGYGEVVDKANFFENAMNERIDIKKYLFNQFPNSVKRCMKKIVYGY